MSKRLRNLGEWALIVALMFALVAVGSSLGSKTGRPIWEGLGFKPTPAKVMAQLHKQLSPVPVDFTAPADIFKQKDRGGVFKYLQVHQKALDDVWANYAKQVGLSNPQVWLNIVNKGTAKSACTGDLLAPNGTASYCGKDKINGRKGVIWYPLDSNMDNESHSMYTLFHENGHHIVDELEEQLNLPDIADALGRSYVENELIAECFAGIMANSYKRAGKLNAAQEAALQHNSQFTADYIHGTAEQRMSAYRLGFDSGMPISCVSRYWVTW